MIKSQLLNTIKSEMFLRTNTFVLQHRDLLITSILVELIVTRLKKLSHVLASRTLKNESAFGLTLIYFTTKLLQKELLAKRNRCRGVNKE